MRKPVLDEVADGRPQAADGPALDGIRRVGGDVAGQRSENGVVRRIEPGVPQPERLEHELTKRIRVLAVESGCGLLVTRIRIGPESRALGRQGLRPLGPVARRV